MKKLIVLNFLILFMLGATHAENKCEKGGDDLLIPIYCSPDTVVTPLMSLNLASYIGKPVDSLLAYLPTGITRTRIGAWRSTRLAEVLYVSYPNDLFIAIHVRQFQYMNPKWENTPNPRAHWDINLFKKEKIAFAIVFKNRQCINGCENIDK